jgi:autotransporter-associated beta strand protein
MIRRLFSILPWRVSNLAAIAVITIGFAWLSQVSAVSIDGAVVLVPKIAIINPTYGGTFGSYTYDAAHDTFYIDIYGGTSGLRKIWRATPGGDWQSTDSVYDLDQQSSTPSDQLRFIRSSDVAGGQVLNSDTGTSIASSILLNPTALTIKVQAPANYEESFGYGPIDGEGKISVTYAPGTLAFITDSGQEVKRGSTVHFDWTKKVYRWDLRAIGDPTTVQPDYNTGKSGDPANPNPGALFGAYGQADWNDVLSTALTEQSLRDAYDAYRATHPSAPALPTASNDNLGRQFAWASNGQSLYVVDSGTVGGGVYKISATQGTATLIYSEPETLGSNVIAEPAVVPTSAHNFGAGFGAGDQILIDGSPAGGNDGGISYIVDTGAAVSTPQVLLSGAKLRNYAELATSNISSIAADSSGNVYFYETGSYALHKLDTQGRLSVVLNKAQIYEVSQSHDGTRDDGGGLLRLQVREDSTGTWVTWRGDNSYIGAVRVFDTGDFNHDGSITQSDRDFFITQYNKTFHGNAPLAVGTNGATINDYVAYISADVNGTSKPIKNGNGALEAASVTYKDLLTLDQFIAHRTGDFNWDGTALNGGDWSIFGGHYNHAPSEFGFTNYSWFDGDVTFDGVVNENDYRRLTLPGDLNYDGTVNSADEAILQSHLGQNVLARNAALGDLTEDGVVNNVDLSILQAHLGQSLVTWNGGGGDNQWSSAANWTDGRTPQFAGDKLVFSGTTQLTTQNNLSDDTSLNGIIFKFDAGSFTLQGNRVRLSEGIVNQSSNNQTVAFDIRIGDDSLTVDTGDAGVDINGVISESVAGTGLIKVGSGTLTLTQANTISGTVEVREGNLNLLGSLASVDNLEVAAGAELTLANTSGNSLSTTSAIENNGVIEVASAEQTVGSIVGSGSTIVRDNATLTASSIVQSSLIIGGTTEAYAVPEPCIILQLLSVGLVCSGMAVHAIKKKQTENR